MNKIKGVSSPSYSHYKDQVVLEVNDLISAFTDLKVEVQMRRNPTFPE